MADDRRLGVDALRHRCPAAGLCLLDVAAANLISYAALGGRASRGPTLRRRPACRMARATVSLGICRRIKDAPPAQGRVAGPRIRWPRLENLSLSAHQVFNDAKGTQKLNRASFQDDLLFGSLTLKSV